jgi:hypothetical protein
MKCLEVIAMYDRMSDLAVWKYILGSVLFQIAFGSDL